MNQIDPHLAETIKTIHGASTSEPPAATLARALVNADGAIVAQARRVTLTAAKTLDPTESGTLYDLALAAGFTVTLPAPQSGLEFHFNVKIAPTTAYIISNALGSSGDNMIGHVLSSSGGAEDTEATAGADVVNFVANVAVIGDKLTVDSDGTYWYVSAKCAAAGGITITD